MGLSLQKDILYSSEGGHLCTGNSKISAVVIARNWLMPGTFGDSLVHIFA